MLASPLTFDLEGDGSDEVLIATKDGEIVFIDQEGFPKYGRTIKLNPLRVDRLWYEGMEGEDIIACLALDKGSTRVSFDEEGRKLGGAPPPPRNKRGAADGSGREEEKVDMQEVFVNMKGWLTPEGIDSLELFLPTDTSANYVSHVLGQKDPLFSQTYREPNAWVTDNDVYLKPRFFATPVLADLDQDGREELILAVSYHLTRDEVPQSAENFNFRKYVAGAVVIVDPESGEVKSTTPLDLTTDTTEYRGYLSSSPVVVDINGNGKYDILVGTGVGYIYALNHHGVVYEDPWPLVLDAVHSEMAVEDVTGDGELDIVATDSNSNVVCFNLQGEDVWERRVSGVVYGGPMIGDVDGDGDLDVVVATSEGHLWALHGKNGQPLEHFPVKLSGRVQSAPLLLKLDPSHAHLGVVVPTTDGHLFIIDGKTACVEKMDFGERTSTMVLADDVTGNGYTDLVVSTNPGHILTLSTTIPHDPRNEWKSENHGRNVRTSKYHQSVYFVRSYLEEHGAMEVVGDSFTVQFRVVDERKKTARDRRYNVKIMFGSLVLYQQYHYTPGFYTVTIDTPGEKRAGALEISMTNDVLQAFDDSVPVSFNRHYDRSIKWVVIFPLLALVFGVMLLSPAETAAHPH
eukprot:TRINITY_DN7459_c0_g1_i1.p1 TRINITY_DN7459_c0_g1~~TRINITY_DN7459_c0_g1_i1.p1  ORF type:complete len:629 (+),score=176.85 TRINITY_DN7459_c0_g1_i1:161-2047(+)